MEKNLSFKCINPLHVFEPILSQEPSVLCWCGSYVFLVSLFSFVQIRPLGFLFERFHTCHFDALYSLLFCMSQGSLWKTILWPIMVFYYKLLLRWRVVSLTLIPHLLICMYGWLLERFFYCTIIEIQRKSI